MAKKKNDSDKNDNVIHFSNMNMSEEEVLRMNGKSEQEIQEYLKLEESDDWLFKAYEAETEEQAFILAKKALQIYPDNFDAQNLIIQFIESPIERLEKYKQNMERAEKKLRNEGVFKDKNIGIFWGLVETRPYMRTRHDYILTLMQLGRYTQAIKECEEMLVLCESDNMGIRYLLMGMYVLLEKYKKAQDLYNCYNEYSTFMLLPLSIMYYKQGKYEKCKKAISDIKDVNQHLYNALIKIERY